MTEEGSVRVVGTAHVSEESVREVEETIETTDPDAVAVELDEGRYRQLQGETPDDLEPGDLLEGNTVFQFLAYWMLSYVQARLGDRFDIEPGAEMLAAVETAEAVGSEVALVDRDIQTTIQRFWSRMTAGEKLRMVGSLSFGVTDPRVAGVTLGVLVGLFLGPVVGLFGGAVGVTDFVLRRATGGAVLAVVAGYLALEAADRRLDELTALATAAGVGVAVGGVLGAGLGVLDAPVTTYLGGFVVDAVGSLTVGLVAGLGVGLAVSAAMTVTGVGRTEDELEEFDPGAMTDADVVTAMMDEFREFSPGGASALIDERDAFIAHHLVDLRRQGKEVVAVVGAGHREGIQHYLDNPEELPAMASLTGTEDGGVPWGTVAGGLVTVGFFAAFIFLGMAGVGRPFLVRLFAAWVVINGVLAAGLAKLAGARWPAAAAGGAIAWFSSIDPLLAPGWIAGYVELRYTTVNVSDISTLNGLLSDEETPIPQLLRQLFDVPLFRLIMIVAATNIGSILGTTLFFAYVLPTFGAELGGPAALTDQMIEGARRTVDLLLGVVGT
ncbi:MAG: TraB/GumN family protein [Halolamina sp.]